MKSNLYETMRKENCDLPDCTCMKCVIRRERSQRRGNYQFSSMGTNYMSNYSEKEVVASPKYFNRSNRNNFDGSYKKHLTSGLMSTMKFDFKPFKVKLDEDNSDKTNLKSFPFFGNSSYKTNFAGYGSPSNGNDPKEDLPYIKIPFRGKSNYLENFKKYKENVYSNRDPNKAIKCSLGFKAFMSPDNTNKKQRFKDFDFKKEIYCPPQKSYKATREKATIIPAKYLDADSTTYENFYNGDNKNCKLESFLHNKGVGFLQL